MGGLLQNLWGPQSDFQAQPPGPAELAFRAAGGLLPPPGQLRVANTGPGRFLGGVTRVGGTLGGLIGEEMAKRRTDLLTRVLPPAQEAMAALSGVRIPTEVNVPRGTFPSEPSEESPTGFVSSSGEPAPPTYEFPGTTIQGSRLPRDYQEAFQNLDPKMQTRLLGASAALPNFNPEKLYGEAKYFNPETGAAVIPPRGGPPQIVAQPQQSPAEQIKQLQFQANDLFGKAVVNELKATGKNDWAEAARSVIRQQPGFWSVLGEEMKNRILGTDKPTETDKALQDYAQAAGYKDWDSVPAKEKVKLREEIKKAPAIAIIQAGIGARQTAAANKPVTAKEAGFWMTQYGEPIPNKEVIGKTEGELIQMGAIRALNVGEVQMMRPIQGMYDTIDKMEIAVNKMFVSLPKNRNLLGQLVSQKSNQALIATLRNSGDRDANMYAATYSILLPNLARIIEHIPGGRLSLGLFGVEGSQLPNPATDSRESAKDKFDLLRARLQESTGIAHKPKKGNAPELPGPPGLSTTNPYSGMSDEEFLKSRNR